MKKGKYGEIYHLSSNKLISIQDLVKKISKCCNRKYLDCIKVSKERIGQDRYYNVSSKKINIEYLSLPKDIKMLHCQIMK